MALDLLGSEHAGITTVIFSGLGTFAAAALAAWQRQQNVRGRRGESSEQIESAQIRNTFDRQQQAFLERMIQDNERYRKDALLWEARARRIDRIAHSMRHDWNNERMRYGIAEPLQDLPSLEDEIR